LLDKSTLAQQVMQYVFLTQRAQTENSKYLEFFSQHDEFSFNFEQSYISFRKKLDVQQTTKSRASRISNHLENCKAVNGVVNL
jgi:hypothetical protein